MHECPDYMEIEGEFDTGTAEVVARVYRETVEKILSRPLNDRTDFMKSMNAKV
jgi:hypothetical protein